MSILPDVLAPDLHLVFCGTAASRISAREHAYYANPTNYFWRTLYQVGLTPRLLTPSEYPQLLDYHIGLTDLAKHATGNDSDLVDSDFDRQALLEKLERYQPQTIAFTSKNAASIALEIPSNKLAYGQFLQGLKGCKVWILPSPSGAARTYWDISYWQALAASYQSSVFSSQ